MSFESSTLLQQIQEYLSYDKDTGEIRWLKSPAKNVYVGGLAGCEKATRRDARGKSVSYRYIRLHGMSIPAQRVAYALYHGDFPQNRIAFEDKNPLNLRIENLKTQNPSSDVKWVVGGNNNEYFSAHRKEHALSYSERDMVRKYGVTLHDYSQMLVAQEGRCAICKSSDAGTRDGKAKALAIDHDHSTGKVRQLLCEACNTGLGKFRDDPNILQAAADYLRRHLSTNETVVEWDQSGVIPSVSTAPADAAQTMRANRAGE